MKRISSLLGLALIMASFGCSPKQPLQADTAASASSTANVSVNATTPQKVVVVDPRVAQALREFNDLEYDTAIPKLKQYCDTRSLSVTDRREACVALAEFTSLNEANANRHGDAVAILAKVIREEPPAYQPDPDVKPLEYLRAYYDARKGRTGGFGIERGDPGLKTIALMDFHNASITTDGDRYDRLQAGLPQLMMNQFEANVNLKVVERARMDWLLNEVKMQSDPATFDQSQAVRVGKLLGAHAVIFGTFIVTDRSHVRIAARVVKVETSEILATMNKEGNPRDFIKLADELAVDLAKKISGSETVSQANDMTKSLDAMMAYAEGLVIEGSQGKEFALEKYRMAAALDPNFQQAKQRVEVLQRAQGMASVIVKTP
jgi:TolB-like protein